MTSISCSGNYLPALIKLKEEGKAKTLTNLISFDKFEESLLEQGRKVGLNIHTFHDVIQVGDESVIVLNPPTPDTIYMFCYTSGTTGDPKAAMLSHKNLITVIQGGQMEGLNLCSDDTVISYLPLAHSFEKCIFVSCTVFRCRYGFYSGDPLKLLDDMQALKPTVFPSVPRLFNRIYDRIQASLAEKSYFS